MILEIKVQPNSKRRKLLFIDRLHCKANLKSSPEDGKANKELIKLLSKYFKVEAKIIKGKTSKNKLVKIEDGDQV